MGTHRRSGARVGSYVRRGMGIFGRRRDAAIASAARAVVEPLEKRTMLSVTATTIS